MSVYWRTQSATTRNLIDVQPAEVGRSCLVISEGTIYQAVSAGTGAARWSVSGSTVAGTTTVTAGTNLVATANTVTPKLNSYPVNTAALALSDGATISTNAIANNIFTVTLGGNRTLANPTNLVVGGWYSWEITQDGTGSRTLAYGTTFRFRNGAPTLTTTAAARDVIFGYYNGTHLIMDVWLDVKA